ncbi:MAG: hypothetical protein J7J98_04515 [candidate division Zixibacteria bacterium]|nr:hypothetical protein [candidate division Zixibacteria bacterium]
MNIRKAVAREWLFILGFAAVALLGSVLSAWLLIPEYPGDLSIYDSVKYPDMTPERRSEGVDAMKAYLTDFENDSIITSLDEYDSAWDPGRKRLLLNRLRVGFYDVARAKNRRDLDAYSEGWELADDIGDASLFVPYPLFLLIRSIMWAFRQVRKKP